MAKAKTPPKSFFGSSRLSEHVFNGIVVSLLDEGDAAPEFGPNALYWHISSSISVKLDYPLRYRILGWHVAMTGVLSKLLAIIRYDGLV